MGDRRSTLRAKPGPASGKENPQEIAQLGDGPNGRTGVVTGRFLADGNRRCKPRKHVHIGFGHLPEKLPCIGRKTLEVTSLPLCKKGIEGQRTFAAATDTRKAYQLVAGQLKVHVPEIVLPSTANNDGKHVGALLILQSTRALGIHRLKSFLRKHSRMANSRTKRWTQKADQWTPACAR